MQRNMQNMNNTQGSNAQGSNMQGSNIHGNNMQGSAPGNGPNAMNNALALQENGNNNIQTKQEAPTRPQKKEKPSLASAVI